jgi:hypothetical protein
MSDLVTREILKAELGRPLVRQCAAWVAMLALAATGAITFD